MLSATRQISTEAFPRRILPVRVPAPQYTSERMSSKTSRVLLVWSSVSAKPCFLHRFALSFAPNTSDTSYRIIVPSSICLKLQTSRRCRPIGSLNRQKPFTDALRMALLSGGGRRLRDHCRAAGGESRAGRLCRPSSEIADRLDGKCAQAIERSDVRSRWKLLS